MSVAGFSKTLKLLLKEQVYPLFKVKAGGKAYREQRKLEFHMMEISPSLLLKGDTVNTNEQAREAFSAIKEKIPLRLKIKHDTYIKYLDQIHNGKDYDIKLFTRDTRVYVSPYKIVIFANSYGNLQTFVRNYINQHLKRNAQVGHTVGHSQGSYNDVSSLARIQNSLDDFTSNNTSLNATQLGNIKKLRKSITKSYKDIHIQYAGDISKNINISKAIAHGSVTFSLTVPQSAQLNEKILGKLEKDIVNKFKKDLLYMEGSRPIIVSIDDQLNQKFLTNKTKAEKSKASTSGKKTLKSKGRTTTTTTYTLPKLRDTKGRYTSTLKIKELLQPLVTAAVGMNMDSANYFKTQTGRFTKSVKIEDVIQSDRSVIVKYNYMQYPYSVFESGGSHHRAGRAPTQIISGSIRQAATQLVGRKFNIIPQLKDY